VKLLACSGGPDSMALLDMEWKKGTELFVCHVNYRKRPTAQRDEDIVRDYCLKHGIAMAVLYPHYETGNFQAWARDVRYEFFCRQARKQGIGTVLTAHQQDDLLETFVFQKERRMLCDWYGLKYRTKRQDLTIERPLLGWRKQDLEDYCRRNQVPFGIDESNLTDAYARNRIRHGMKEEERPVLLREISLANRRLLAKQRRAACFFADHPSADLFSQEDGPALLETWIWQQTENHLSGRQTRELFRQLQKNCVCELQEWFIERHDDRLMAASKPLAAIQTCEIQTPEELRRLPMVDNTARLPETDPVQRLSVQPEDFPLTIRSPRPGDGMEMRFGWKKLSRFFIDRHISRLERSRWYVVVNRAGKVIYVPGWGCDRHHFAGGQTFCFRQFSPATVHDKIKNVTFKEKQV